MKQIILDEDGKKQRGEARKNKVRNNFYTEFYCNTDEELFDYLKQLTDDYQKRGAEHWVQILADETEVSLITKNIVCACLNQIKSTLFQFIEL